MKEKNNRNQQRDPFWMIHNAESLRRVVKHLQEQSLDAPDLFSGRVLAGPILLSLAIELALKAWLCQEQRKEPPRGHNLLDLFQQLQPVTQESLQAEMPAWTMYPVGFPEGAPYPHESLQELLWRHRNAHTHWRYIHEKPSATYQTSLLDQALTVIISNYYRKWLCSGM